MPTIEENIEAALFAHVVELDVTGGPPIAWPNVPFPSPGQGKSTTYLEVRNFPNRNTRFFMHGSDPHWRQGILQITVIAPLGAGPNPVTKLAGEIAEHFPADLPLFSGGVKVRVQQAPDVYPAEKSDDEVSWSTHVDVRYEAYV